MLDRAQVVEAPIGWAFGQVLDEARRVWTRIADVLTVYAEVNGAVTRNEELSRLSDAERRGMARRDLNRRIFETVTR